LALEAKQQGREITITEKDTDGTIKGEYYEAPKGRGGHIQKKRGTGTKLADLSGMGGIE